MHGGDGPPFVYLHSTLGEVVHVAAVLPDAGPSSSACWCRRIPASARAAASTRSTRIEDMAFHYVELFDALGLDEVILGGVSLGGWIAAEFAVRWPERVKKLWIADAPGLWVEDQPLPRSVPRHARSRTSCASCCSTTRTAHMAQLVIEDEPDEDKMLSAYQSMTVLARLVWERPYDPKLAARLHRVQCPMLLLWGDHDRLVPPAYGEAYQQASAAGGIEADLPNCGHLPMFEQEAEFVETITAFCK